MLFFFFNATATTEIYTLSLHDALPIFSALKAVRPLISHFTPLYFCVCVFNSSSATGLGSPRLSWSQDRKSTRLNSSHVRISYAVFCLKKKKKLRSSFCMDTFTAQHVTT